MQAHAFEAASTPTPPQRSNYNGNTANVQVPPPCNSVTEARRAYLSTGTGLSAPALVTCPTCGKSVFSDSIRSDSGLPDGEPCVWHQHFEGAW